MQVRIEDLKKTVVEELGLIAKGLFSYILNKSLDYCLLNHAACGI
jgi:hypothetical protein